MECNVGGWDRAMRTAGLAGALALGLCGRLTTGTRATMFLIAAAEAFTVLTRYCPLNQALGINTCDQDHRSTLTEGSLPRTGQYLEERRPEHYAG